MSRFATRGSTGMRRFVAFTDAQNRDVEGATLVGAWYQREGAAPVHFTASADLQEHALLDDAVPTPVQHGSHYSFLVPDLALEKEVGVSEVVVTLVAAQGGTEYVARVAIEIPPLPELNPDGMVPATLREDPRHVLKDIAVSAAPAPTASVFSVDDARLSTHPNAYARHTLLSFSSGVVALVTGYAVGAGNVRTFTVKQIDDTGAPVDLPVAIDVSWTFDLRLI